MDNQKLESLILRILSGEYTLEILDEPYIIKQPSVKLQQDAQELYYKIIDQNRFQLWISEKTCLSSLINAKLLSPVYLTEQKNLYDTLESLKLDLYLNFFNKKKQKRLRKLIQDTNDRLNKIHNIIHTLDYLTLKGYAFLQKKEFLLFNTIYINDQLAFMVNTVNFALFNNICNRIVFNYLTESQYREIAKSIEWRKYWQVTKNNASSIFNKLTHEQLTLVSFSKMYDSVYEDVDCPDTEIINDDDVLDGWFVYKSKEMKKNRKQRQANSILNKHKDSQEVFITATSSQDIKNIEDLNSVQSAAIKRQREKVIKEKGKIKDKDLPDRKLALHQQSHQKYIETVKNMKKK